MSRLLALYNEYSTVKRRLSVGEATPSDISTLREIKLLLAKEWSNADTQLQSRTKEMYERVQAFLDDTIADAEQNVQMSGFEFDATEEAEGKNEDTPALMSKSS